MKKVSLMIAALALVLGISQCKKQEEPAASGEKQHIVLNASFGDSNAKIAEDGTGGLKWTDEDGHKDIIKVYNGSGTEIGTLECTDAANGTFEGDITASEGQITFTFGTKPDNYTNQTGNLEDAIYLESDKIDYRADGNYGEVKMNMPHAVLKLDLSAFASNDRDGVTVTIQSYYEPLASVLNITPASKAVYVAMPAAESTVYIFSGNGKAASKNNWPPLAANTFYTKNGSGDAIVIEPVGGKITYFDDCETNDNLEFNFTIEPNVGCVVIGVTLYLSLNEPFPDIDNNDLSIDYDGLSYETGSISISKNDLINNPPFYESDQTIYIRLWATIQDSGGYCTVCVYSDVINASFEFGEEEEE